MNRPLFRGVNGVVALATLALGSMQLALGVKSPVYGDADLPVMPALDSNLRFFGGMAIGLGLLMLWALPSIERRPDVVAVFWGCAFLGGIGRLLSAVVVGLPNTPLLVFAVVEVVGAPLMVIWHRRLVAATGP